MAEVEVWFDVTQVEFPVRGAVCRDAARGKDPDAEKMIKAAAGGCSGRPIGRTKLTALSSGSSHKPPKKKAS